MVAVAIIFIGVHELKDETAPAAAGGPARPTPRAGPSPSGHAAHSVIYPWLALDARASRLRPGMAGRLGAARRSGSRWRRWSGCRRVYLRVHYLSDVSGGWALGVSAFALCGGGRHGRHATYGRMPVARCRRLVGARRLSTCLFGGAGLISLLAFAALILVPAIGSYGAAWEKATAAVLSLFVLAALVLLGRRARRR